mgnify:CR=1 FL=1
MRRNKKIMEYRIECEDKDFDLLLKEYKEIPLTQGKVALVDAEDYEYLNQFKWHAHKYKNGGGYYVARGIKKNEKKVFMHQEVLKPPKGMYPDHINRDGLDNRRWNLRICTTSQNGINKGKQKNNTSGYKGVCWHKRDEKWQARIKVDKKPMYLGYFNTKEEAALAYNEAAKQYFGEFAKLNNF